MAMDILNHHDAFGSTSRIPQHEHAEEKYLRPGSGKLVSLVVQQATTNTRRPGQSLSRITRLSQWAHTFSLISLFSLVPAVSRAATQRLECGGTEDTGTWRRTGRLRKHISPIITLAQWADSSPWAWVPACVLLLFVLMIPQGVGGTPENGGKYDPVRAYDRQYAEVARNRKEGRHQPEKRSDDAEREEGESTPLIPHNPEDIEMAAVTPYTSTSSLVPTVPRAGQAPDWTETTPGTTTTSLASTIRGSSTTEGKEVDEDDLLERRFAPSHLCFLEYDKNGDPIGYATRKVTDWVREHNGDHSGTDYVFLSYTRAQFGVFTEEGLDEMGVEDPETRRTLLHIATFDRATLERRGIEAAHQAGKKAFWWDFECIKNPDGSAAATVNNPEVYGICDIARAAHSMVVLVGPSVESKKSRPRREYSEECLAQWLDEGGKTYSQEAMTEWMQDWGSRLWTLTEILLISPEEPVKVYAIGGPRPPERWAKRNFASRSVWKDAKLIRQLIDHYESSIHLEPLELLSLAMECFFHRVAGERFKGDKAYALMGLLRRRPMVNIKDSEFTAFARLSLANDSEALLERLICLQPLEVGKAWHYQRGFGTRNSGTLNRSIAGIADDETVVLDGAYGATIEWSTMKPVYFFTRPTFRRTLTKWMLRGSPYYLIAAIGLVYFSASAISQINQFRADIQEDRSAKGRPTVSEADPPSADTFVGLLVLFVFILISALGSSLAAPAMILRLYVGKFWNTQASFVGMEGIPDRLGLVEEYLFAADRGRLKWSAAGGTMSRHEESEDYRGECVGLPPLLEYNTGYDSEGNNDHLRAFTIIDTYSMMAMAFRAARPPTAVIVCGQEGGMQRAALYSYDWKRNTFSREQVIRLKTAVLDRMFRMDRFRFSFKRRAVSQQAAKTA